MSWQLDGFTEVDGVGSGGFGRVVLARHHASGVLLAIKYLHPRFLANPEVLAALRPEAARLRAVQSPQVVRVYDVVETELGAAVVMEAVPGVSLRSVLAAEGVQPPESALVVLKGSLLGLAAAHAQGVVHRDLKPANVLLRPDGRVQLVDFALAVLDGQGGLAAASPAYLPPEQWAGRPAAPATDVYAATCVFAQCLSGREPYAADTSAAYRELHERAPVPVSVAPVPLQGLIARGMAKDPGQRPPAAALLGELEAAAAAGYGPGWEQHGWRRLAPAAAALVRLSPVGLLTRTMTPPATPASRPATRRAKRRSGSTGRRRRP